jgi:RNA polymerase sigma-70 factor (ECF subfamily)
MTAFAAAAVSSDEDRFSAREDWRRFEQTLTVEDLRALRRIAVRLAGGTMDPDDLLQDALERACRSFDRFEPGTNLQAWMRTIMQRLVIDDWRRKGRRKEVSADELVSPPPGEEEAPPAWSRYDIDEVRRALVRLSEPLQTTFRMYSLGGKSYAAIGAELGIPLATVGTRLRRARLRLKRMLESAGRHGEVIDIRSAMGNSEQFCGVHQGRA